MKMMLFLDPPDHTRLRGLVSKAFIPRAIDAMSVRIQQLADGLLDTVQEAGQMDVIQDFAAPLSATVIAELLDVPQEERQRFRNWTSLLLKFFSQSTQAAENIVHLKTYFADVIAQRQISPKDDLLGVIMDAYNSGILDFDDVFSVYILLVDAGQVTTTNLIGNGLLALIRHPDQLQRLRNARSLTTSVVNELLRYDSPVQFTTRIAKEDIQVGNKRILKGQTVTLVLGAANRDPEQFLNPDILDIGRQDNKHVGFGYGIHFCLGAALALLETQIAISTLLCRFPTIRLIQEPKWQENINFRFLQSLPITFE
jgi:cytochrome P450